MCVKCSLSKSLTSVLLFFSPLTGFLSTRCCQAYYVVWNFKKTNTVALLILKLIKYKKIVSQTVDDIGIKQPINTRLGTKAARILDITFSHHLLSLSNPQQGPTEKLPVNRLK